MPYEPDPIDPTDYPMPAEGPFTNAVYESQKAQIVRLTAALKAAEDTDARHCYEARERIDLERDNKALWQSRAEAAEDELSKWGQHEKLWERWHEIEIPIIDAARELTKYSKNEYAPIGFAGELAKLERLVSELDEARAALSASPAPDQLRERLRALCDGWAQATNPNTSSVYRRCAAELRALIGE